MWVSEYIDVPVREAMIVIFVVLAGVVLIVFGGFCVCGFIGVDFQAVDSPFVLFMIVGIDD